ncbi:protein FAR1-RELATED SEQUENCE 5-like [Rosa chinensis]|uniref:protein FAR1-RELATED SEQUENCE 5-like n=1 Tax=Rosa chinensis TaxID=74649 RepID=UPI000D0909B1|nr:protein FAR1-RELATED SEQUENCE 5-like [Rosa chinensis]
MDGSYEPSISDIGLVSQSSINGSDCNEMQYKGVRYDKLSTEDLKGQKFKTVEEAESFYNAYAKAMGFDVRSDYKRLSIRITGRVTSLRLVCSAQGKRREEYMSNKKRVRKPKKETRFNCPCLFKVRYRSNINAYIVDDFITIHSHHLAQAHELHLLRSHRSVEDHHLALATSMQKVSVKPCHTYEYIVDRSGGFKNVGFIMKDLYNKLDSRRREILLEGDAENALTYMRGKVATDSHFYCKFSIDEDNRLANMFWRDSNSLVDYTCFGDVLVFDSTYKTNSYEKSLVLFVGSNNHLSTTVFGFALLMDETIETYTWVLETFISSMNIKRPVAVLTDGDEAMRRALSKKEGQDLSKFAANAKKENKAKFQYFVFEKCEKLSYTLLICLIELLKQIFHVVTIYSVQIFIPILDEGVKGNHWFLMVVKIRSMEVEILDSFPSSARKTPRENPAEDTGHDI